MSSDSDSAALTGGCFCGAVRYRAASHTDSVAHCHCGHCRAASGAPFMTWVEVPRADLDWTDGEPGAYRHSSDWRSPVTRRFCRECGTSLTYERDDSEYLDVALGSLDEPDAVRPAHHVYESRRLEWLRLDDDLPRYPEGRPSSR